ncbi:MAG: DEAD/DEAH box helicase [Actinomycetia bacterium]|nr:DEAD/DEAH box helicase [Actinomycetes bacterium]MCP4961833.1 DEAD/DEAH box helicase [Actinomycetes bacterium]
MPAEVLDRFSPVVREWFDTTFAAPTNAQTEGWSAISQGKHSLILAPTGSGKTLAAFLWAIDRIMTDPVPDKGERCRVLYISPLRALAVDVEKNLRSPLRGVALAAERTGESVHEPTVGIRTGDTPPNERRRLVTRPPDILITTPESLFLMLTSKARESLRNVQYVIIDEIHSVAATKRGTHLAVSLERLDEISAKAPQRIGLSATQRPLDEIAQFLGGSVAGKPRDVAVVDVGSTKQLDIEVIVPVDDMAEPARGAELQPESPQNSIWPAIHPRLLELILDHRSTIIFVNARRLAERLASRLNELHTAGLNRGDTYEGSSIAEGEELVKAHHGSLSREQRLQIEDELKSGRLRALVATSSLELGIDMGAVDLVIQVESPGSVSSGLQRIGRAGHQVGAPSRGKIFPKHRSDLLEAAVVVERMRNGLIERTHYPRNPLDVLAQQVVAICAMEDRATDELLTLVRRAAPYRDLSDEVFESVLDMLSGRYPSDDFAELKPRIVWDRVAGVVRARQGAGRLAVTNAGTIPDRGLYGVFLTDGKRVGELDEEMVYESRVGETFLLGASTWRIEEITPDRVVVSPAPGQPGKMPFWHGDGPGRPLELGQAIGAFTRSIIDELPADVEVAIAEGGLDETFARLDDNNDLDRRAAANLVAFLADQRHATGVVPDDRTIVVERFRDEIGDWRVCILTPFGARVHAPWAVAVQSKLEERFDMAVDTMWTDDGIVLRLPESEDRLPDDILLIAPDEIEDLIVAQLPGTAMFASRFREIAGRALLLPRRRPGQRTPLWQQRQRAANLLQVAARYPSFPMLLETSRECLQEVFDVPALRELLADLHRRKIRLVSVDTEHASPMAQSLLFNWIATFMYDGDAPLAERRATALALDRDLLRDLLGAEELRELIDPGVLADLELELQRLVEGRMARDGDELTDLLRLLGDLTLDELGARSTFEPEPAIRDLIEHRRVVQISIGGEVRFIAAEDAGRYRDAVGCALPIGLPAAFTESVGDPLADLMARWARTHGPFLVSEPARRLGVPVDRARSAIVRVAALGRLTHGEFRPDGREREWCDVDVLRSLRRRSLAALRREVEPVDAEAFARFVTRWHGLDRPRRGPDALGDTLVQLQGAAIPASVLESDVLASRVRDYSPAALDSLLASGAVVWAGAGGLGSSDGRIRLVFREQAALLLDQPTDAPGGPIQDALREQLTRRGASFWPELLASAGVADEASVLEALWDLVWSGEVTNDTFAPVRALLASGSSRRTSTRRGRPRPGQLRRIGPPSAAGRWSSTQALFVPQPTATEKSHLRALQLIERHGVLTREGALADGVVGGFAGIYPVLRALEERGQVRRGYFVEGLGGAQFAASGAVDRLREFREAPDPAQIDVLSAVDPAQPYGATLPWPESRGRPSRTAGTYLILVDGTPVLFVERGGRSLATFEQTAQKSVLWIAPLRSLVDSGRVNGLQIAKIDGEPSHGHPIADMLLADEFSAGYKGPTYRA